MELSDNSLSDMNKTTSSFSSSSHNHGCFPSPGAPYYRERNRNIENQKGWSSERVSSNSKHLTSNFSRRHTMSGLTPFNIGVGGRTMPSKWDEAERWICSPVSAADESRTRRRRSDRSGLQARPKSISGPIVAPPPGVAAAFYSPVGVPHHHHQGGFVVRNLMVGSPFSTGVLAPVAVSVHHHYDSHDAVSVFGYDVDNVGMQCSGHHVLQSSRTSTTAQTCTQLPSVLPPSPISQDEKHDVMKDEDTLMCLSSKCDKGTQMSPEESENGYSHTSPKSCANSVMDQQGCHSPKSEVRDVQVDCQATVVRGYKRHAVKLTKKNSQNSRDSRENKAEAQVACWDIQESTLDNSKLQREEAKIIAWENLQKAKAEAAIRKLEMKLEKKRSSSMDKILNKLRRAQLKAENKRSIIPVQVQQGHQVSKTCKVFSFPKYSQIWSPGTCFGRAMLGDRS